MHLVGWNNSQIKGKVKLFRRYQELTDDKLI